MANIFTRVARRIAGFFTPNKINKPATSQIPTNSNAISIIGDGVRKENLKILHDRLKDVKTELTKTGSHLPVGTFRESPVVNDLNMLTSQSLKNDDVINSIFKEKSLDDQAIALAAAIKKTVRNLKEPILSEDEQKSIIEASSIEKTKEVLQNLSEDKRETLNIVNDSLLMALDETKSTTKMTYDNLGVVMGPNLFPNFSQPDLISQAVLVNKATATILQNHRDIYPELPAFTNNPPPETEAIDQPPEFTKTPPPRPISDDLLEESSTDDEYDIDSAIGEDSRSSSPQPKEPAIDEGVEADFDNLARERAEKSSTSPSPNPKNPIAKELSVNDQQNMR